MASNRELKAEIETLSKELGVTVSTDRLNNEKLTELRDQLLEQKALLDQLEEADRAKSEQTAPEPAQSAESVQEGATREEAPESTPAPPPPPPAQVVAVAGPFDPSARYVVAPGKSLSTRRGIRGPGSTITANELGNGVETLCFLYERGFVIRG